MLPSEIKFYLSGGAANSDIEEARGGEISTTEISATALNNLFEDVTNDQMNSGRITYRCFYVKNTSAQTLNAAIIWISSNSPSTDTTFSLGLDPVGVNDEAEFITSPMGWGGTTAPAAVTFSQAGSPRNALSLGNLASGDYYPIWIRRKIDDDALTDVTDPVTISVSGIPV